MYLDRTSLLADTFCFARVLTYRRIKNYIRLRLHHWLRSTAGFAYTGPASLSIETASFCNLKCPECLTGTANLQRDKPFPDTKSCQKLIEELHPTLISLLFFFQGEPLLNRETETMIKDAHKKNIYTVISTNAQNISHERAGKIVKSGLSKLIISIDGTTQETYQKYRIGGRLEKVLEAVEHLNHWKKILRSNYPVITGQFIVFRHNEHQLKELKTFLKKAGFNKMEVKSAQLNDYQDKSSLIPENKKYSRYRYSSETREVTLKKPIRNTCFKMWHSAVVNAGGDLLPCCFDKHSQYKMGSTHEESFIKAWNSARYHAFRKKVHSNRKDMEMCCNCGQ